MGGGFYTQRAGFFLILAVALLVALQISFVDAQISETNKTVLEEQTKQATAVINRASKWIKVVKDGNVTIELPRGAKNISVRTDDEVIEALGEIKEYEQIIESANKKDLLSGEITGDVSLEVNKRRGVIKKIGNWLSSFSATGEVIGEGEIKDKIFESRDGKIIDLENITDLTQAANISVEYYTQGPRAIEEGIKRGKRIRVWTDDESNYTDVLTYAIIDEVFNVGQEKLIKIYWQENDSYINFTAYDTNNNGKLDYVEWITPHLSNQTFDVILVIKALHLDSNRQLISDIYEEVKSLDGNFSETIPANDYVRFTFEINLTPQRVIDIYPRILSGSPTIELYEANGAKLITKLDNIQENKYNKLNLSNLSEGQDTFDLLILGGSIQIDHIIDPTGHMIAFWDGGAVPSGWTCISCNSGEAFFDRFVKGAATYGTTGGADTTSHTAAWVSSNSSTNPGNNLKTANKQTLAAGVHAHNSLNSGSAAAVSTLPAYRTLKVIINNNPGEPATLPAGLIAVFDAAVPTGWTRYSPQDNNFIRGSGTENTSAGANTHSHSVSITTGSPSATVTGDDPNNINIATSTHTHTGSGTTNSSDNIPPYLDVVLGKLNSESAPLDGLIMIWNDTPPVTWDLVSNTGQAFNEKFIRGAATYGGTGGSSTHNHANIAIDTGAPSASVSSRSDVQVSGATTTHSHQITVSFSSPNHEPANRQAIFAKRNAAQPIINQEKFRWKWTNNTFAADNDTNITVDDSNINNLKFKLAFKINNTGGSTSGLTQFRIEGCAGEGCSFAAGLPTGWGYITGGTLGAQAFAECTTSELEEKENSSTNIDIASNACAELQWHIQAPDTAGSNVYWFRVNNTNSTKGNYTASPAKVTVVNNAPAVSNVVASPAFVLNNTILNITATVIDRTLDTVLVQIEWPNGTAKENRTTQNSSNTFWANFTFDARDILGNYTAKIWANDSVSQVNFTETKKFAPYVNLSDNEAITIDGSFSDWAAVTNISDPVGDQLERSFDSTLNLTYDFGGTDIAYAITKDSSNNIYVGGREGSAVDWRIMKFDSGGVSLWNLSYNFDGNNDTIYAIAVDSADNLYVAGSEGNSTTTDWRIMKFNSGGVSQWNLTYNLGSQDVSYGVLTDSSNNLYVVGNVSDDWRIMKFDSNGVSLWNLSYNLGGTDIAYAITKDSSNNIYVGGREGTANDWRIMKFDSNGVSLWNLSYNLGGTDIAYAITKDSSNNIYVGGVGGSLSDWRIMKFDSGGVSLWNISYGNFGGTDEVRGLITDSSNKLYAVGGGGTTSSWRMMKFHSNSTNLQNNTYAFPGTTDVAYATAIDSAHNLYAVGQEAASTWRIMKFSITGPQVDIANLSLANDNSNLYAKVQMSGSLDMSNQSRYIRMFISNGSTIGSTTTPDTNLELPFRYQYRVQVNGTSSCLVYNSTPSKIGTCGVGNNSNTLEFNVSLSDIKASNNKDQLNITFETGDNLSLRFDIAPDLGSFLMYNVSIVAGATDLSFTLSYPSSGCTQGYGCESGGCSACIRCAFKATDTTGNTDENQTNCEGQTSTVPFFIMNNTGNVAENWTLFLNASLPSTHYLKASQGSGGYQGICTDTEPPTTTSCILINTTNRTIANVAVGGGQHVWFWADFVAASAGNTSRNVTGYTTQKP